MSSMRRSMVADSTAVLMVCALTAYGSHTPSSFMSAISPVWPLMPKHECSSAACLARSLVRVRMTLAPQFCMRVRGMTSSAVPTARYGSDSTPSIFSAMSWMPLHTAISAAPPPGRRRGSITTLRATPMASWRLRSTSLRTSRDAPRRMMEHALGSLQSTMKEKYSSPIFFTSKRPAPVPMSDSDASSGRCTMVAPQQRAMRLLSVLRRRRMAVMPALERKCVARSLRPFSVMTRSGLSDAICAHIFSIHSSSSLSNTDQSSSFISSTFVCDSPFLYSNGQSNKRMRGLVILRCMRIGATTSLLNITPLSTRQSSIAPPAIFSTLAYFLMSISRLPSPCSTATHMTASSASSDIIDPNRSAYLVPMQELMMLSICSRFPKSIGNATSSITFCASSSAFRYPRQMTVGWMFFSKNGSAALSISPAKMMTDVVPSPTSSSCVRESSIIDLAHGCDTSISRKMALPSFVSTMPPDASKSIFSIERGPRVVRIMSATAFAAWMLPS
mmetsp:Transcript_5841/g.19877  ORF Transcript_5841/g.19877 Transcript_5841/m.19877 type:complete len:502 (-) Transcript_5841:120-1625(-)